MSSPQTQIAPEPTPQTVRPAAGTSSATRSLAGASVIVAGATGGLGRPIVDHLLDHGARVTQVARSDDRFHTGALTKAVSGDLADPAVCALAVEAAAAEGSIDGIINVAGVVAFGPVEELDDDTLVELFTTNVFGPIRLIRAALPRLDGGFVANVTGVVAEQPMAGMVAYSASKAALSSATESLRRELRRRKIDVIELRPPHTETGLAEHPIAGAAPRLPTGLDPDVVARRVLDAIVGRERAVPADEFEGASAG